MADFHVSVSLDNVLRVFSGGVLIDQVTVATNRGRLRADFGIADFNAGSYVAYKVYFNNLYRTEGFFQWSADNQNYVGVSSRGTVEVNIDNFEAGTINVPFTAPAAHPDVLATLVSLTPTMPPFDTGAVNFSSVAGVTYRADIANTVTNEFTPAGGAVAGESVIQATNTTAAGSLNWPGAYTNSGFLRILPVHWPGPILP
jgi:hypothetical protein